MVIPYGIVIEKGQILKLLYVFDLEQVLPKNKALSNFA